MISIVTFKWDTGQVHDKKKIKFTADHVNRLASMLRRHVTVPYKFICITDNPSGIDESVITYPLWDDNRDMGGCYVRLKMFSKDPEIRQLVGDRFVWIDLDCVILDNMDEILKTKHEFCAWGDTHPRTPYNGSLVMLETGKRPQVWEDFQRHESQILGRRVGFVGTDQAWIAYRLGSREFRWTSRDGIYSFRIHIEKMKKIDPPTNAKIIMFHGRHDPSHPYLQNKYPWIRENWR